MIPIHDSIKVIRRFRLISRSFLRASFWNPEFFLEKWNIMLFLNISNVTWKIPIRNVPQKNHDFAMHKGNYDKGQNILDKQKNPRESIVPLRRWEIFFTLQTQQFVVQLVSSDFGVCENWSHYWNDTEFAMLAFFACIIVTPK